MSYLSPVFRNAKCETQNAELETHVAEQWLKQAEPLLLVLILILATGFRFYDLPRLPPGLWFDEALDGLNALSILHDDPVRIYFDNREFFGGGTQNAEEPMYHYLLAVAIAILGPTALAIRATSAVIGVVTVGAFYGMVRTIWGRGMALLAATILAVFRWHFHFSRVGFRTILVPLFACLFFALWWRGFEKRKRSNLILAGVFLGLGFYTYPAFQLLVPAWVCLVFWRMLREPERRRDLLHGLAWPVATAFVILLPLLGYFVTHREVAAGRVGSLTVFKHAKQERAVDPEAPTGWQRLGENLWLNARHFWWNGDPVPKHNVPMTLRRGERKGMAVFDPLTSAFFALGLFVTVAGAWRDPRNVLVLSWAAWLACASIFSFGAPNLLRTLGMVPAVVLILANGYMLLARLIDRYISRSAAVLALLALLAWFGANEGRRYFIDWRNHPLVPQDFNAPYCSLADTIVAYWGEDDVHIPGDYYHHPTLRYLLYGRDNVYEMKMPDSFARTSDTTRNRILVTTPMTFPQSAGWGRGQSTLEKLRLGGRPAWVSPDRFFVAFEIPAGQLMTPERAAEAIRGFQINPAR